MVLGVGLEKSRAGKQVVAATAPPGGLAKRPAGLWSWTVIVMPQIPSTKIERVSDRRWRYKNGDNRIQLSHPQTSKGGENIHPRVHPKTLSFYISSVKHKGKKDHLCVARHTNNDNTINMGDVQQVDKEGQET